MSTDPALRPYGDSAPDHFVGAPHLSDYWRVVSSRIWLVLLIFTVTTAASIWAVSRQRVFYQGTMSLQVNDPLERQRGLVGGSRVSGMDIFVDPIVSEIEVLRSATIANTVVDSVGLRLRRVPADALRSDLFHEVHVDAAAPNGRYQIAYAPDGARAVFRAPDGSVLGESRIGQPLDAGFVTFTPLPPPDEARTYDVDIVPGGAVAGEIAFSASQRESTNIIDVALVHPDPYIVPLALNHAGRALRDKGAERVRESARADMDFIDARLEEASQNLQASADAIQEFKTTRAFVDLSARERQLVDRSETLTNDIRTWARQRSVLVDLVRTIETDGVDGAELASVLAELPPGSNPQVRAAIEEVQDLRATERRLMIEERKSEGHPQVLAVRSEIVERGRQLIEVAEAGLRVVEARLGELADAQQEVRTEQRAFPALEGELQSLEAQRTLDRDSYQFLMSQLYQAQITQAAASPYVEILDPAAGAGRIQSRGRVNVFLGALLGLILGVGAAFFLEYLDRTVRTTADVEALLAVPVLGVIPRLRRVDDAREEAQQLKGRGLPMVVAMDPLDPAAESYRNLRMNLMFMSTDEDPIRTILFSSPGPSEGKSTTAVNFAVMLARQGQRVLVIDADLRRPSLHRALDVLREPGLTNLLIGNADTREAIRPNVLPNLDFLPSGPFPPNPSELLSSKAMARVLEELEGRYDQIVIDSPPVLAVTDAAVLAVHTDGAVLVLRSGETDQRAAERSMDQLRRLGVRVFGAVLNEAGSPGSEDGYYLHYYYGDQRPEPGPWGRLREGLAKVRFFG